jgi:hypothetical protein
MKDEKNSNNRFEKSFSNPVVFSKNLIAILESISFKKDTGNCVSVKLIIDEEIDEIIKYKFITDDRHEHYPFLFIIALLQNAVKHGIESDQNKDKVDVFLSVNKEYLEFKNLTYPQNMDDAIRSANQTTLKAITYYFDIVAENSNTRTFVYETSDHKQSSDKKWFIAKLPRI